MSWSLIPLAGVASQPWRNGGGVTRELLAWPTRENWQVRISVAEVDAEGPFSRFEGVERWFAVLEGDGMELHARRVFHRLTPASDPFRFDGDEPVNCALLGGPTRDFNLMAAPGSARLRRVRGSLPVMTREPTLLAVYAHAQGARIMFGGETIEVPAAHLAWRLQDQPLTGTLHGQDALLVEARR
jgi:environmental stress-induced protein Ves